MNFFAWPFYRELFCGGDFYQLLRGDLFRALFRIGFARALFCRGIFPCRLPQGRFCFHFPNAFTVGSFPGASSLNTLPLIIYMDSFAGQFFMPFLAGLLLHALSQRFYRWLLPGDILRDYFRTDKLWTPSRRFFSCPFWQSFFCMHIRSAFTVGSLPGHPT